ncbi:MAG: Ribonuclease Z [Promethearchaeota archaeon]|nr:MAG: Ribonuclease Z [Candidatus Lokiarchaeota archaeon]
MKITFLGTSGSVLTKENSYPSILLNDDLLLDCGEGTTQKLLHLNSIDSIHTICFSHLHNDHILGLFSLLWYYWINGRREKISIIGPKGIKDTFEQIIKLIHTPPDMKSCELEYRELEISNSINSISMGYAMEYVHMEHSIPTIAYKIMEKDVAMCYAGDTKPNRNLKELSEDCELLICESTFPDDQKEIAHKYNHSTPSDVISIAKEVNCKNVALTHISPPYREIVKKDKERLSKDFNGKIIIAEDLLSLSL